MRNFIGRNSNAGPIRIFLMYRKLAKHPIITQFFSDSALQFCVMSFCTRTMYRTKNSDKYLCKKLT